jgi:hypothetical protein
MEVPINEDKAEARGVVLVSDLRTTYYDNAITATKSHVLTFFDIN